MNRATWTGARAMLFARGLYHIAAVDGLDAREVRAINAFLAQVGLPLDPQALGAEPFDHVEAARLLDSTWLRRTFLQACRFMVQLDGKVTEAERDALRAMAAALGVGERVALADIDGPPPSPEALVQWIADRAVDFVSWDDDVQRGWFWPFPHPTHPIAEHAALLVAPGQALVVRSGERTTDVLVEPGEHLLTPATLPGLAAAQSWHGGPVEANLLYVRTGPSPRLRWGTVDAIMVQAPGLGTVPIRAFGRFGVRVVDPGLVADRMARAGVPPDEEVELRLRRMVAGRFGEALSRLRFGSADDFRDTLEDLDALVAQVLPFLREGLLRGGLGVEGFRIENLTAPLELGLSPASSRTRSMTRVGQSLLGTTPEAPAATGAQLRPCDECLAPVPIAARFCPKCGSTRRRPCGHCGHDLPSRARFCPACGARQAGE